MDTVGRGALLQWLRPRHWREGWQNRWVRGRGNDRVNHGRLGPKGLHGWQANHSDSRLTLPLIRRGNHFHEVSWDEAMGMIVQRSKYIVTDIRVV